MADHVKVFFRLEKDDDTDYPPVDVERIWTRPLGDGEYEVDNIPFFVRGLACGDVVTAQIDDDSDEDNLYFDETVRYSGHSTFRIVMFDVDRTDEVRAKLLGFGCATETCNIDGLIAVDLPKGVAPRPVVTYLAAGEEQGTWSYEEACIAYELPSDDSV